MTKLLLIPIFLFTVNAFAEGNPAIYRSYHCEAEGPDHTKYLADIFHIWKSPYEPTKGYIVLKTDSADALPQLIQDVAIREEKNKQGILCNFIAEFTLNWGGSTGFVLNIDKCHGFPSYAGTATATYEKNGKQ
jgi:hypothetical protein